jgi:hypothetical protein
MVRKSTRDKVGILIYKRPIIYLVAELCHLLKKELELVGSVVKCDIV